MTDPPLTLDELRTAVSDLTGALLQHRTLDDQQWDHAIAILLAAREQHGGRIRHLIHTVLNVGHCAAPAGALPAALSELHCHLALADDPPRPAPAPVSDTARTRTRPRRQRRHTVAHTQLNLFDPDVATS